MGIMLVIYLYVLLLGLALWISGRQELTNQARQALPPDAVEQWYEELRARRIWGQTLILACTMIAFVYLV